MARLVLSSPEGQQVVELRPHNTMGRHPSNTIQLLDKVVSKEHCIILQRDSEYVLQDLGSLNGTFINGERVNGEQTLRHGDMILMGSTHVSFDAHGSGPIGVSYTPAPEQSPQPTWQTGNPHPPGVVMPTHPSGLQGQPSAATSFGAPGHAAAGQLANNPIVPSPITGTRVISPTGTRPVRMIGETQAGAPRRMNETRVDMVDSGRSIGDQIDATAQGFVPFEQLTNNPTQLAADYERLRLSHELSREIALERELTSLLNKILQSVFRFIRADRGVIFLKDESGVLVPSASLRRDGSSDAIAVSSTILDHVMNDRKTVLTHDAAMDFSGSKGKSMILHRISSAIVAPLLHNDDLLGVLWLDSETLARFQAKDLELVTSIAAQAAMFIEINILGRKVEQEAVARERFSRLLSPNIAEKVLSGEMVVQRGGQLVDCTVFNSDIRGFTNMSEGAAPEAIVEMLNEYFERMVEAVFKYEGTLDKFMGDGIMALWGAPVSHPDDAFRSVCSALEQLQLLDEFNDERAARYNSPPLGIGVGVHTGRVVAGYIGSSRALSYTVIGDTANTSARLCGVANAGQILVSEATLSQLNGRFDYRELEPVQLKGKRAPFRVFEIQRPAQGVAVPEAMTSTDPGPDG